MVTNSFFYIWLCQSVLALVVYRPFDAPHMFVCRGPRHHRTTTSSWTMSGCQTKPVPFHPWHLTWTFFTRISSCQATNSLFMVLVESRTKHFTICIFYSKNICLPLVGVVIVDFLSHHEEAVLQWIIFLALHVANIRNTTLFTSVFYLRSCDTGLQKSRPCVVWIRRDTWDDHCPNHRITSWQGLLHTIVRL